MNTRRRWSGSLAAAVAWLAAGPVLAAGAGTTGGAALSIGGSARALGMGGAGAGALAEAAAVWVNPAQLARLDSPQLSFMHGAYAGSVSLEQFAVAGPVAPVPGRLGAALTSLRAGTLDVVDSVGTPAGTFSPGEIAVTGSWAIQRGRLAVGAAASWITSDLGLGAEASAFAGDVGVSLAPTPELTLGVAAQHLGTALGYGGAEAALPLTIRGGAAYALQPFRLTFAVDAVKPADADVSVRGGAEKGFAVRPDVSVAARAGYATAGPRGGLAGLALGAGVHWRPADVPGGERAIEGEPRRWDIRGVRVDYAWTPLGELGAAHWFSVGLLF